MKLREFNRRLNEHGFRCVVLESDEFDVISSDLDDERLEHYDYYAISFIEEQGALIIKPHCPNSIKNILVEFSSTPINDRDYADVENDKSERKKYWNF